MHAGEMGSGVVKNSAVNPEILSAKESASSTSMAVIESFNQYSPFMVQDQGHVPPPV